MKSGTDWVTERTRNTEAKAVGVFLKKTSEKRALSNARGTRDNERASKISHEGLKHGQIMKVIVYYIISQSLVGSVSISSLSPSRSAPSSPGVSVGSQLLSTAFSSTLTIPYDLVQWVLSVVDPRCAASSPVLSTTYVVLGFLAH